MMFGGPPEADTPEALFMACHERIRCTLMGIEALIALDDPSDPRAGPTASACARYLRDGLPLHGQDEDHSLAPRLLAHEPSGALRAALRQLEAEHAALDEGLPEVLLGLDAVVRGEPAALEEPYRWLSELLIEHITLEEAVVFPAIAGLSEAEQRAIVTEIRARRRG